MTKTRWTALALALLLILALCGCGGGAAEDAEPQYRTAEELHQAMENGDNLLLLDVQPQDQYDQHHIAGVTATFAFPCDTPETQAILKDYVKDLKSFDGDVILICPMGKMGSGNAFDYFVSQGVDPAKLYILEGGQTGWPYEYEGTGPVEE